MVEFNKFKNLSYDYCYHRRLFRQVTIGGSVYRSRQKKGRNRSRKSLSTFLELGSRNFGNWNNSDITYSFAEINELYQDLLYPKFELYHRIEINFMLKNTSSYSTKKEIMKSYLMLIASISHCLLKKNANFVRPENMS